MTPTADQVGLGPKQLTFMRESGCRVNLLEGSIRSGKTIVSLLRWLMFVAAAPRGGELVMVGRTRDALYRNVLQPLQDPALFGPLAKLTKYTNGAPTARIMGRTIHVLGASDAKAEKIIRGMTVAGAYVDEITVIPEEFFTQLLGRMSVVGAQLFGTTNPDSPAHWLKKKFIDRVRSGTLKDWAVWHFTLEDNPSLTETYKDSIKSEYTGLWYRRFILGEWVAAEGAIYDMWDPDVHVVPHDKLPTLVDIISVGVDYGTTNPTHAVALGLTAEHPQRLVLLDEWRYAAGDGGQRWTDVQLSEGLRNWLAGLRKEHNLVPRWIFLDPSAASFYTQLASKQTPGLTSADNSVTYGIRTISGLLTRNRLIVSDRCRHLIEEFPGYSWDPKATERGEDKPLKVADHGLDAARYAITTSEKFWFRYLQ